MIRILLAVDDPEQDIQNRLQRMSYDVLTASADEVTESVDELRPDIILMNVRLKGETDGIEVAQQIKSRHDIPIIFMTANADEATVRRAITAEPDGFLIKPLDALELRAAIEMATRRHGMKANAHESDRRIREITESLSEVIFETDMAGNITFVNRAGLQEFGYTQEQVEGGMTLYDIVPADKHKEIRESIAQAVIDEPSEWIEVPGLRRDGSIFPVSVRASVIVREGVPVGIRGIALNVTDQKRAEQKLEESERRIRELTDALPVVVYETDATGRMIFVNATAYDLFGYVKEEVEAGMSIFQLIAPADLERARAVFRRRMRGEDVGRVEYIGLRKDESTFPISIRSTLMWQDAAVVGQRGVILDFTELKRAEEEIKEHTRTTEILNLIVTEGSRATNVQSFAEAATNLTLELMCFDVGTIHLVDDDARSANLRYATGIPDTTVEAFRKIPLDEAPYAPFLVEPSPLFIDGHEASRVPHVAEVGLESLAVVPLYRYNTIVGVLTFGSFTRHTFSQTEKELLIAIGNEVGTVLAKLQTDEALKEGERRIRELTDALPEVVYEADATGAFSFVSASCLEMFGYTKEEFEAGLTVFDVIVTDDRARGRETFRQRMDATELGWVEYTGLRKDGSTIPLSVSARPIHHDGVVIGTRGIAADNTQRKRSEERLRESENRFRAVTDSAADAIFSVDMQGNVIYWNKAAERTFGWTADDITGQSVTAILPESAKAGFFKMLPTLSTRETYVPPSSTLWRRKDGAEFPAEPSFASWKTKEGTFATAIVRDISEQKAIIESVQAGIVLIDPITHTIVDVNTMGAHLFGSSKDAIIGSVCHRFICPAEVGRCPITDLGQTVDNAERVLLTEDGKSRPILKSVSGITLRGHAYLLESFVDIGDRKQMERALLESEAYYRAIFESTATGMAILEDDMTVAMGNSKLEQLTGFRKNEVEGLKPLTEFVAPEDLPRIKRYHRARRRDAASAPKEYEFRLLTKDGTRREVFVTAALIPGTKRSVVSIVDVSALKSAQEAVRKQAAMLDAARDCIVTLDPEGIITYWNRGAERLYGWTTHEAEGQNANALLRTRFPESREVLWPKLMESGLWEGELINVTRDGVEVTVASSWTLMKDEKGNASAILEISSDITERKKAEAALHGVQEELRQHATMFDAARDAIMTLDPEGIITYWNRGAEHLYGWTKHEAEGQNANALLRTRFPESREALWPKLMESGLWEGELINVTRDGVEVTVASSWTLMRDEKGNASAILEISSDITERKKAEAALAESEAKLRITFATMADGIVIAQLNETVTDCNEAILRLTQRSREEIIGKPFEDLLPPEFRSLIPDARKFLVGAVLARTEPSRGKKETVRTDSQLLRKNGERVNIEANISTIEDASGQPAEFLIVARDVTERKQMEFQLDSSLADLQRSNAELEQFAYVTSHDLQEPLRMITSYIQIIEEDYKGKLDADADQYIAFAVEGAKRMHTLVNDLLAYSRVGTRGEPFMPISLNNVLSAATANLELAIEESHAVVTHDRLPTVLGDESQLIQLFQNLLGNAIKFRSDAPPSIHVGVEQTKDGWEFSVHDNGIGVDMKYAERIFSVFQRLHAREEYPGTGIGLAVVKKIVERHGGRIWVQSEPANGSTFYFTLPKGE
jgi:PAS domain S-box-containing protein